MEISNFATKVSAKETFQYAPIYPCGLIDGVFELTDYGADTENFIKEVLGVVVPSRIQFSAVPSHITAIAVYEGFSIDIYVNTVKTWNTGLSDLEDVLKRSASYKVNGQCNLEKTAIDASFALVRDVLIGYWVGIK